MNWQLAIVGVIVAGAAAYLMRQTWRSWHPARGKCGGCCDRDRPPASAAATTDLIAPEKLSIKHRRTSP